jgi:hypothetical protein
MGYGRFKQKNSLLLNSRLRLCAKRFKSIFLSFSSGRTAGCENAKVRLRQWERYSTYSVFRKPSVLIYTGSDGAH